MPINDLNQRYTIEKYCTRMEVAKALGTNLIEPFWKEIADFRNRLSIVLPIFDTFRSNFTLTYIDQVTAKSSQLNSLVSTYVGAYLKLKSGSLAEHTFTSDMLKSCLKQVARVHKIDVSEITLSKIVQNQPVEDIYEPLVRYKKALFNFENQSFGTIGEDFLANEYAILRGELELTSFYRTNDNESAASMMLIDKDYDHGVPAHMIEEMMTKLFEYINNTSISLLARISAIFFVFNYVKPFKHHNRELAALLAKRIIASAEVNASAIYLPVELMFSNKDFYEGITQEVKKTHDFTYALISASACICDAIEAANARINQVHAHTLESEVQIGTDSAKIKEEFGSRVELIQPNKTSETKKQIQERLEKPLENVETEELSEKELKAKIEDILEINPNISKKQAHFYVHHSQKGRFYTIQQFVKFEKCVYETARTSMDALAAQGYYRRESIKNKFVYTPIDKE